MRDRMTETTPVAPPGPPVAPGPASPLASQPGEPSLRERAARGTLINTGFEIGLYTLTFGRGLIIAAFLTRAEYGVWGILVVTLGTLAVLKQIGISDKFVQQDDPDEERAFQQAFTLELFSNGILTVILLIALPLFAAAYGQPQIFLPGLVIVATVPIQSFRAPAWVFYRNMRFARQRLLDAADPVVGFVVTVGLAIGGYGYWSLVIGFASGVLAAALVAVVFSPYRLALRYDKRIMRGYFAFSWPLLVASGSGLLIPQLSVFIGEAKVGLAGVGAMGLAGTIVSYTDRVDQLVTWTLYPAICRVKDRLDLLEEAFVKTNRLALMWGIPFGVSLALFAPDLVHYALGPRWEAAVGLIQVFGLVAALNHIGFNWTAFFRARGDTRPMAVVGPVTLLAFLLVPVPLLLTVGLRGYAIGMGVMALVSLAARTYYLTKTFPQFRMLRHAARSVAPSVPAAALVLLLRVAGLHGGLGVALAELALYVSVTVAATLVLERALLREVLGYVRGGHGLAPGGAT